MTRSTRRSVLAAAIAAAALPRKLTAGQEIHAMNGLNAITAIDYTVIFARDMEALRPFYQDVMGFALRRELATMVEVVLVVGSQTSSARTGSNTRSAVRFLR